MSNEKEKRNWIPEFIRHDFFRKLIAFVMALLIWLTVQSLIDREKELNGIKVKLQIPKSYILMDNVPNLSLKIKASENKLRELSSSDFSVSKKIIPDSYKNAQTLEVNLNSQDIKKPPMVSILDFEPEKFYIRLDRKTEIPKKVDVKLNFTGRPSKGYKVANYNTTPAQVNLSGPISIVEKIESVKTKAIILDDTLVDSFDKNIEIAPIREGLSVSPSSVLAKVDIIRDQSTKTFRNIKIKILRPSSLSDKNVELFSTPHVDITLTGSKQKLEKLDRKKIKAFIDLSKEDNSGKLSEGRLRSQVNCWLGGITGIYINHIEPKFVELVIKSKNQGKKDKKQEE